MNFGMLVFHWSLPETGYVSWVFHLLSTSSDVLLESGDVARLLFRTDTSISDGNHYPWILSSQCDVKKICSEDLRS